MLEFFTEKVTIRHEVTFLVLSLLIIITILLRLFPYYYSDAIIQEMDPHFNLRVAQHIEKYGISSFFNWFDNDSWYPFGRFIGETSYPGLMIITYLAKQLLEKIHIVISLYFACLFIGIISSIIIVLFAYHYGKLLEGNTMGLLFATFVALNPVLISRTNIGSYDYECLSITLIFICIFYYNKALIHSSIFYCIISSIFFGILAWSWGGYIFVIGILTLHSIFLIAFGHFDVKNYIIYSTWFIFAVLLAAALPTISIRFMTKGDHIIMIILFLFVQFYSAIVAMNKLLSEKSRNTIVLVVFAAFVCFIFMLWPFLANTFEGRFYRFMFPLKEEKDLQVNIQEHQPTAWSLYFVSNGPLFYLFPVGIFILLKEKMFLLFLVSSFSFYSTVMMNRTLLVFAPFQAIVCAFAFDRIMNGLIKNQQIYKIHKILFVSFLFLLCVFHSNNTVHYAGDVENFVQYQIETPEGVVLSDDHRDLYQWIRNNAKNAKIASFWDIGYQLQALTGCSTYVDGNTNNRTHIANIEMLYLSDEENSWRISRSFDVDYILTTFGGASGFEMDDIMKFPLVLQNLPTFFPNVSLSEYQNEDVFLVSESMKPKFRDSMLFKMSYNKFVNFKFGSKTKPGFDTIRGFVVKNQLFKISKFSEAYTSQNWLVRLYRVQKDPQWNRVY